MANITIALDDELLQASREYAQRHQTSLNAIIRDLLDRTVRNHERAWIEEFIEHTERARGNSQGRTWKRDDLYDV